MKQRRLSFLKKNYRTRYSWTLSPEPFHRLTLAILICWYVTIYSMASQVVLVFRTLVEQQLMQCRRVGYSGYFFVKITYFCTSCIFPEMGGHFYQNVPRAMPWVRLALSLGKGLSKVWKSFGEKRVELGEKWQNGWKTLLQHFGKIRVANPSCNVNQCKGQIYFRLDDKLRNTVSARWRRGTFLHTHQV